MLEQEQAREGLGFVFIQTEAAALRHRIFGSVFLLRFSFVIAAFSFFKNTAIKTETP